MARNTLMKAYAGALLAIITVYYAWFLIPNFNLCVRETGTWRACTHWLIR